MNICHPATRRAPRPSDCACNIYQRCCTTCVAAEFKHEERAGIVAFLRRPNADGTPCSCEREILAQRIEKGEHWA